MIRVVTVGIAVLLLAGCGGEAASALASAQPSVTTSAEPSVSPSATPYAHVVAATPNPELRDELLAMMAEDQAVRTGVAPPGDDRTPEELSAAWADVDASNALRMREILDEHGWPGWSLVGEDGALAAWVLIQHADFNLDLQRRGLEMLAAAVEAGDASPGDLAYLVDRVRVAEGRPQVYGTQVQMGPDGEPMPRTPIEDPENVDARRAEAGLPTLEEYYAEMRTIMEAEATPAP